jgi:hypothetical protein
MELRTKLLLMTFSPKKDEYEQVAIKNLGNFLEDIWTERQKLLKLKQQQTKAVYLKLYS